MSAFTSSEASEPTSLPRRLLGTAVNLSTIIRHGARSPLSALGWTESLKIGAGVGSVVKGHTTIEEAQSTIDDVERYLKENDPRTAQPTTATPGTTTPPPTTGGRNPRDSFNSLLEQYGH